MIFTNLNSGDQTGPRNSIHEVIMHLETELQIIIFPISTGQIYDQSLTAKKRDSGISIHAADILSYIPWPRGWCGGGVLWFT